VPVTVNRHLPINQFSEKLRKSIKSKECSGGLLTETGFKSNCYDEVFQSTLHLPPVKPAYQSTLLQLQIQMVSAQLKKEKERSPRWSTRSWQEWPPVERSPRWSRDEVWGGRRGREEL